MTKEEIQSGNHDEAFPIPDSYLAIGVASSSLPWAYAYLSLDVEASQAP